MDDNDKDKLGDLVGFEQDPEDDDFGAGTFTRADGSKFYSKDPGAAQALDRQGKATADKPPEESLYSPPEVADPPAPEALPQVAAAPPPAPQQSTLQLPEQPPQQRSPLSIVGSSQQRGATQSQSDTQSQQRGATQSQEGNVSSQTQRTGSAVPQEMYEKMRTDQTGAFDRASQGVDASQAAEQQAYAQRANAMRADAMARETAAASAQAAQEQRAQVAQQQVTERAARPIDPNKIWKDKGILGTVGGLLGIAIGGATSAALGIENTALKSINEQKQQNIQAQMADRDSELRSLERELGSIEAAKPVLEARMNSAIQERGDALMVDEKSAQARGAWQKYRGELEIEKQQKLQEAAKAQFGTLAQSQAQSKGQSQQTSQNATQQRTNTAGQSLEQADQRKLMIKGAGGPDLKKGFEILKLAEANGYDRGQLAALSKTLGLPNSAGGETSEEFDRRAKAEEAAKASPEASAEQAKARSAADVLSNFYTKAGLVRDQSGKWVVSDKGAVPPGFVESVNPFDDNEIEAHGLAAKEAWGRLESGGVIGKDEDPAFAEQVGLNTGNRAQLAAKANALDAALHARMRSTDVRPSGIMIGKKVGQ